MSLGSENPNCVFLQAMQQLHFLNPALLRQKDRCFKVIFKGESAEGEGETIFNLLSVIVGPYRESISQMCLELQGNAVPLLIPCPNQQLAKESIGVGENREKFILNPATSALHLNMYQFLGKLMGVAIRSRNPLSLDLPSIIWKPLVSH
jgi:E3 ubiquitin-protein ligase HERC2